MKRQYAAYVIALIIIIILSFGWCNSEKEKNTLSKNLAEATDKFRVDSLKNGQELIIQKQNLADERNAKSYLEQENEQLSKKLKKIQAVVSTKSEVQIQEKIIRYHDTVVKYATDSTLCIPIGTRIDTATQWYSLGAVIDTFGLSGLALTVPINSVTVLGTPKQKLLKSIFKPEQPSVIQTYDNPNVKIVATNNRVVNQVKPPKRGVWFVVGTIIGAAVVTGVMLSH